MKKKYIVPQTLALTIDTENFIAISPTVGLTHDSVMQYDGDQFHQDLHDHPNGIAGPASEYVGTDNDPNPVDEGDIFN